VISTRTFIVAQSVIGIQWLEAESVTPVSAEKIDAADPGAQWMVAGGRHTKLAMQ
jgi:hypothetical protein